MPSPRVKAASAAVVVVDSVVDLEADLAAVEAAGEVVAAAVVAEEEEEGEVTLEVDVVVSEVRNFFHLEQQFGNINNHCIF